MSQHFDHTRIVSIRRRFRLAAVLAPLLITAAVFFMLYPLIAGHSRRHALHELQSRLDAAVNMLCVYQEQIEAGRLSPVQAQELAASRLSAMRFGPDETEHLWICGRDHVMIAHPFRPDLEGRDVSTYTDPEGTRVFGVLVDSAVRSGHAQLEHAWIDPLEPDRVLDVTSAARAFEPWGWVVAAQDRGAGHSLRMAEYIRTLMIICAMVFGLSALASLVAVRYHLLAERERSALQHKQEDVMNDFKAEEEKYRALVDNIPIGVLLLDPNLRVVAANETIRTWFSKLDQAAGRFCYKVMQGEDAEAPCWYCPTRRTVEDRLVHKAIVEKEIGGEARLFRVASNAVMGADGELKAVIEMFDDITEYRNAELALQDQIRFMHSLMNATPVPIYFKDIEGRYRNCNKSFQSISGLAESQILGKTVFDILPQREAAEHHARDQELLKSGSEDTYEAKAVIDGFERSVIISKAVYSNLDGQPAGVIGAIADITELKQYERSLRQAEEKYRSIFENAPLGVFRSSFEGRFLEVNKTLASMLGYESSEQAIEEISDIATQLYADPAQRRDILRLLSEKPQGASFDVLFKRRDRSPFHATLHARVMHDDAGRPICLDGLIEDSSARKAAEETLKKAKNEAEAASRLKTNFLSSVSHEMRTPLTSVLGYAKLAGKKFSKYAPPLLNSADERTRAALSQVDENLLGIVSEGERLLELINNLLDLASLEENRMILAPKHAHVPDLLRRAFDEASPRLKLKGLDAHIDAPDELPTVVCDPFRILQLLRNLLSNAIKFTEQGRITLAARLEEDHIEVSVSDTGPGFAEDQQIAVFNAFTQLGDSLTQKPAGAGLGLPICQRIVERHGGALWASSVPGKGSTFFFTLPLNSPLQPGEPSPSTSDTTPRPST